MRCARVLIPVEATNALDNDTKRQILERSNETLTK